VRASCSFAHAGLIIDRPTRRIFIARIGSPGGKELEPVLSDMLTADRGGPTMFAPIGVMS
jgi:hypothetical protein